MATGPWHYQRAEIAQDAAAAMQANRPNGPNATPLEALLDALVHATLAVAAAMALNDNHPAGEGMRWQDRDEWLRAAATDPEATP